MPEPLYSIVSQRHTTRLDHRSEHPVEGLEITFGYGEPVAHGVVFVPGEVPEPELVRAAILDYVHRGLQVQGLTE